MNERIGGQVRFYLYVFHKHFVHFLFYFFYLSLFIFLFCLFNAGKQEQSTTSTISLPMQPLYMIFCFSQLRFFYSDLNATMSQLWIKIRIIYFELKKKKISIIYLKIEDSTPQPIIVSQISYLVTFFQCSYLIGKKNLQILLNQISHILLILLLST